MEFAYTTTAYNTKFFLFKSMLQITLKLVQTSSWNSSLIDLSRIRSNDRKQRLQVETGVDKDPVNV
jgi:hypothetical protein